MADLPITVILPNGSARNAEVPDDVACRDLVAELATLLSLPTVGPDGRPMGYRLDSKALGRELTEDETLSQAGIPAEDRLIVTADITAGAVSVANSPRMRRLKADHKRMEELAAQSDFISFTTKSAKRGLPPDRYIVTFTCKGIIGVDRQGNPQFGERHQVEIYLHNDYPHRWPGMKWMSSVWHPNIHHANGTVCVDAAWWTASRSLDRLVLMIGEMVQYKNFHDDPTKPPFPWDPEAARWSRDYRKKNPDFFPIDTRELLHPERVHMKEGAKAKPAAKAKIKMGKQDKPAGKKILGIKFGKQPEAAKSSGKIKLGGASKSSGSVKLGKNNKTDDTKNSRIRLK